MALTPALPRYSEPFHGRQESQQGHRPRRRQHREGIRQGLDHAPQGGQTSTDGRAGRPDRAASGSTSRWASAATRAGASSRSTARSRAARRRSPCTPSPASRSRAGWPRSSTPSTPSIPTYARKLGVKTDELLISQPDYGEQALEIADMLVRSGAVDIIVVDSVAALVPKAEIEGDMGDSHVGTQARLMSQALRKLTSTVAQSNCLLVFINQIRMKIGVMFGSPRRPQAATRSSSTPPFASTFAASAPSRRPRQPPTRRTRWSSATAPGSRS